MTLRAKLFEQRLWATLKQYDLRRRLSFWRRALLVLDQPVAPPLWLLRSVLFLLTGSILLVCRESVVAHAPMWIAGMSIYGTLVAVGRANVLDPQYRTLWMLPLGSEGIFQHLVRRAFLGNWPVLLEFFLLYSLIAGSVRASGTLWLMAVVCAGLQGIVSVALTLFIKSIPPRFENLQILVWLPILPALGLLIFGSPAAVHIAAKSLYFYHPAGWVNAVFVEGCIRANTVAWFALLPISGILATLPRSIRATRLLNADGFFRVHRAKSRLLQNPSPQSLDQDWPARGMVERLLARFLTPRERIIVGSLLLDRPRWSQSFYGLVIYSAIFLCASAFIEFTSFYDLIAAWLRNYDERVAKALFGCLACLVLSAFMIFHAIRLFAWHVLPQGGMLPGSAFVFQLLPLNCWEVVKSILKVNSVMALLLVPLTMLFSFTPIFQIFKWQSGEINLVLKLLVASWAFATFVPSLTLRPPFLAGIRHWRSFLAVSVITFILGALVLGLFHSPTTAADIGVIVGLVSVTLSWLTYAGFRYSRGL